LGRRKFCSMSQYRSEVTVTVTPSFSKKYGPHTPNSVFRFNVNPVARMFETHSRIVFRSGTGARRPSLKCLRNALCVAITDSFLKNVSTTKPRCSPDQSMASAENGKTAANQRDHSHHFTPSTTRAVTPPKVGVISAAPCTNRLTKQNVASNSDNAIPYAGDGSSGEV